MTLGLRRRRSALKVEADREGVVVRFVSRGAALNEATVPLFGARLDGVTGALERRRLVLDCANLDFVSSIALTAFLRLRKQVQAVGGSVVLRNLQDLVHEVLEVTRLASLFEMEWCADPAASTSPAADGHPATVLVVDDSEPVRSVLECALRGQEMEVLLAATGKEGLRQYLRAKGTVAAVLLDVQMPGWSGPETFAALCAVDACVSCCFMSGHLGGYTEAELFRLGAAEVFEKPFSLDDVVQTILDLVGRTAPVGTSQG